MPAPMTDSDNRRPEKKVIDPEIKYEELKSNLPVVEERYKQGKISKERYEKYLAKIKAWEGE